MRVALFALLLSSCVVETFTDGSAGTVYECVAPDATVAEWCSILSADGLSEATGRHCERTDRWWPALTNALSNGCIYSCEPHGGCNARSGCWCE